MILKRMILNNFRQFKGKHIIDFAQPEDGTSITVIYGENGRGKTGIFRAMIYCLFGDKTLAQDGDLSKNEIRLVNTSLLYSNPESEANAYVELQFQHRGESYHIKRSVCGVLANGEILEEDNGVSLSITDASGNTKIVESNDELKKYIHAVLDPRVKDYFLFDGEKIERLTRASFDQRREISEAVRNLLNVNALEIAIKALQKVEKTFDKELDNNSNIELKKIKFQIGQNEEEQEKIRVELETYATQITEAKKEIKRLDTLLEEYNEIKGLIEKRNRIEESLKSDENVKSELLTHMRDSFVKCSLMLVEDVNNEVFAFIDQKKKKGAIPSEIRKDLLEKIISEKRCICGTDITKDAKTYEHILEWLQKSTDSTFQDVALDIWRHLSEIINSVDKNDYDIEKTLTKYANVNLSIRTNQDDLDSLHEEIGSSERKDAGSLEQQRKNIYQDIGSFEAKSINKAECLNNLIEEKKELEQRYHVERLKSDINDEVAKRSFVAHDALEMLRKIYEEFTIEIKRKLGEYASEYFHLLLDIEGQSVLRTIIVNDDYSLDVLDRYRKPFLANISAGQRQIMSISFIAALAKIASNNHTMEIPLFMDTPFGRLSSEHRKNLITHVPSFSQQWILLATDTEFTKSIARMLKQCGQWGKLYKLSPLDGDTQIKEHDIENTTFLKEEEVAV